MFIAETLLIEIVVNKTFLQLSGLSSPLSQQSIGFLIEDNDPAAALNSQTSRVTLVITMLIY